MSRLPRSLEHLKTAFTAEAKSAALYRACARRAEEEGLPNLARAWLDLASEKERLAERLIIATGQIRGGELDLESALAEEEFENEVLYPKMLREVDPGAAEVLQEIVTAQTEHAARLEDLRAQLQSSAEDIPAGAGAPTTGAR